MGLYCHISDRLMPHKMYNIYLPESKHECKGIASIVQRVVKVK